MSAVGRACLLLLAVTLGLSLPLQASVQDQDHEVVIGSWEGKVDFGDGITVVFNVGRAEDGGLAGTLRGPGDGATGIPLSSVTFDEGTLTLIASSVPGTPTFIGKRSEDGAGLTGTFLQGGGRFPLELTRRT